MANTNETKRTPVVSAAIEGQTLMLSFIGGQTLTLDATTLSEELRGYAVMHGLKQKLVDAAAISRNPDTGKSASPEDKYNAVKAVYDRLLAGAWNAPRGEGAGAGGGLLVRALVRMYEGKRTVEQIREFLAGKTAAEQAALRKNPRVAAIIEEIKAEQAAGDDAPDTDAMLDELEG